MPRRKHKDLRKTWFDTFAQIAALTIFMFAFAPFPRFGVWLVGFFTGAILWSALWTTSDELNARIEEIDRIKGRSHEQ